MSRFICLKQAFGRGLAVAVLCIVSALSGCASLESSRSSRLGTSSAREEIYLNQPNLKNLIMEHQENSVSGKRSSKRNSAEHASNQKGNRDEKAFSQWKESRRIPFSSQVPLLEEPKVKSIWIEDQIRGNRFIEGHFEHIIEENAKWSK